MLGKKRCGILYCIVLSFICSALYRPLSQRLDRCDRMIQNESRDPNGGNVYYVTMQITFLTRKFRNVERNLHCDVIHITTVWVSSVTLDCNGVFSIMAYCNSPVHAQKFFTLMYGHVAAIQKVRMFVIDVIVMDTADDRRVLAIRSSVESRKFV